MDLVTNRPLAIIGLTSYRYSGRFGWIMIGAKNNQEALNEARRSTDDDVSIAKLQIWDGFRYIQA